MSYLVEKSFPFSSHVVSTDTANDPDAMQQMVFALLECLGDTGSLLRSEEKTSDLERLEHKIDLLIFMLNNLIQPSQVRPAAQLLRLTADSIAWQHSEPLSAGRHVIIELYLHPRVAMPLRCEARIEHQEQGWTYASLAGLSEEAQSAWSKWVFRQHRHQIALAREQEQRQSG